MKVSIGIITWPIIIALAGLAGCAAGGTTGGASSYMSRCQEAAKTKAERSECAWKNAERNASGS